MYDLEFVRTFIDDLLVITKGSWEDHIKKLEQVFECLRCAGLQINPAKSFWGKDECEHLGFIVNRSGLKPQPKKIEAMRQLKPPKTRTQLRRLIGLCDFCRDLHLRRSHLMAPLTELSSDSVPFEWKDEHQKSFEEIKKAFCKEVLLAHPNFNQPFDIHADASDCQLGSVISQNGRPMAFYSRKLSPAQQSCTVAEKEQLSLLRPLLNFAQFSWVNS